LASNDALTPAVLRQGKAEKVRAAAFSEVTLILKTIFSHGQHLSMCLCHDENQKRQDYQ
jgi:hypothetical protein